MLRNVQPQPQPDPSIQQARNPLRVMLVFCNLNHQHNRLDKVSVRPNSAIHSLDPSKLFLQLEADFQVPLPV
jgi:hypothetical protein